MSRRLARFVVALAVIVSLTGNTGVARAAISAPPSVGSQNLQPPRAPGSQPAALPALAIPPASSIGVQFVHVATAANIDAHTTLIDHPLTNGNPGATVLVTPNWNPGGVTGTFDNRHIGVFYNFTLSRWGIYNEDSSAMQAGAAFNVIIPTAGTGVFVQTVSASANSTTIDNALANGNPNAILLVTPVWNPGGGVTGNNANFPISVLYNSILGRWTIFDQSGAAMTPGTSFNVFVLTAGAGAFVHTAASSGTGSFYTLIDNPLTNGHPNAIVFITPNLQPGGLLDEHPTGVLYDNGYWKIINRDAVNMPVGAAFHVVVLVPRSDIFLHTATADNTVSSYTRLDNALTNAPGNTNAVVFATPNFNPGDGAGVFNNHNIAVAYSFSGWAISNQDTAAILPNASFNVLVPDPDTSVFVHKATAANISLNGTTIDYPLTNGDPNAILLVTPNYDPGDVGGTLDDHPIGVYYVGGKWEILNQDTMAMPAGAAFNVYVPKAASGVFTHTATAVNSGANITVIDNALTNGNPNALILVTPNYNPGGIGGGVSANFPVGVGYASGVYKWAIVNQNGGSSTMPVGASFNVYVFGNYRAYLPLLLKNF